LKAKNISGQAPGGKREKLADVLPLNAPYVVQIFPVYGCNFKCKYCIFSIDVKSRGFISEKVILNFDLFKKCIDDMTQFREQIKVLRFVGIGEPLLHKNIADMVAYAVSKKVAKITEIITNASLLSPRLSDALISAGLSRLVVSLQGTSKEKYKEVCGIDISFEELTENLKYFYDQKRNIQMYVKIIDCALDSKADETKFYRIFGDICDTIAIEHAVPIHSGVNFGNVLREKNKDVTQFGLPVSDVHICPQPFFALQINPDGKVVPCYSFEYPGIMGDCNHQSVIDIWSGQEFQNLRRKMLDGSKHVGEICTDCEIIKYRLFPEDVLNDDADRLKYCYDL
jgi:radical SAM protein with 4Fe4S-binding SPASM domain